MFWNLMFIMAATVSSCDLISVGPKMTPRLETVIRFDWLCAETLHVEETCEMLFSADTPIMETLNRVLTVLLFIKL